MPRRNKNCAISEGQAIANAIGRETVRLKGPFNEIIADVPKLGRVMALTRNGSAVNEKVGAYKNVSFDHAGLVVAPNIDLRIFYSQWKHGYAVTEETEKGTQRSLQFYDTIASAVIKPMHGENVMASQYKGYRPLTAEALVPASPDVIITTNET